MTGMARWLAIAAAVSLVAGVMVLLALFSAFNAAGPLTGKVSVVIPKGVGVNGIAVELRDRGVIRSALIFELGVRLTGNQGRLRAGEYEFPGGASASGAMAILLSGRTVVHKVTIPEGLTSAQAVRLVAEARGLDGPVGAPPAEGMLLPDTYHFSHGDSRVELMARMQRAMEAEIDRLWLDRAPDLPLNSPRDAVILASIVEKETARAAERPLIAGVFYNRMRRGMALQSDPTVAYGVALAEGRPGRVLDRALTRQDLESPGPYNTYLNRGLPPTPIANPGRASLTAVLHPGQTEALYFVADGRGGHVFARTLAEHNRNVRRWRRLRDDAISPRQSDTPKPLRNGIRKVPEMP